MTTLSRTSTAAAGAAQRPGAAGLGLPPALGLLALAAVLWPHWLWMVGRWRDGSDDPLGLVALLALALAAPRCAAAMTRQPSAAWLGAALAGCVAATAALFVAPPLVGALLAALTLAAALRAFLPPGQPSLAIGGLTLLALPLISSLQFYAGFPLRLATAQLSTWLLQAFGAEAQRSGAAMLVNGRLIIVDAPCSGVQMVWMAYFCACAAALWTQQADRVFLRRLAGVGAIVLAGNVLRNSVLVLLEAQPAPLAGWLHQGVGLMVLAMVCSAVVVVVGRRGQAPRSSTSAARRWQSAPELPSAHGRLRAWPERRRIKHGPPARAVLAAVPGSTPERLAIGLLLAVCAVMPFARPAQTATPVPTMPLELPAQWDGHPLRPMALSAVEQRFAAQFPGRIERMSDGRRTLVLREVHHATRMLHPAADCYRGLGYRIEQARLEQDAEQRLWRCFDAVRPGGASLRVCERITDRQGNAWTDTSAWFWAAASGSTQGPWRAVTIATPLGEGT